MIAAIFLASATTLAAKPGKSRTPEESFDADVELAPFVVRGEQLAISIHARSSRDRKYAEGFAEEVVKVVYDGVTEHTGKGLVIIGAKGEPHPMAIFRKFQQMASAGQLDPEVAAAAGELNTFLDEWKGSLHDGKSSADDAAEDVDIDFEQVINALPLPLEGVSAKLYQLAWAEGFDDAKVTSRLRALRADEVRRDLFAHFDWVFYMPYRGALDRALDDIIAQALKDSDMGFFTRAAAKTALVVAKPFIRRAVEGVRKSVLFMTVVRARTEYSQEQVSELVDAYMESMMPDSPGKRHGSGHDSAVWAVREVRERWDDAAPAVVPVGAMADVIQDTDRPGFEKAAAPRG